MRRNRRGGRGRGSEEEKGREGERKGGGREGGEGERKGGGREGEEGEEPRVWDVRIYMREMRILKS